MDWFKKDNKNEQQKSAKNAKGAQDALNEAEQALEGDPLQEAVKKNQNDKQ
jgi:SspJ family small acid-soluble spore protein